VQTRCLAQGIVYSAPEGGQSEGCGQGKDKAGEQSVHDNPRWSSGAKGWAGGVLA
jgi:hypothetical protein